MTNFRIVLLVALVSIVSFPQMASSRDGAPLRAIVFTTTGIGVSGYLMGIRVGIEDDTLVLTSSSGTELFPVASLSKMVILPAEHQGNLFLAGSIVGTYASTLLIGNQDGMPAGYLEESFAGGAGMLFTTLIGVLVGGGVGVLINSGSSDELILEFNSSIKENKEARAKLYGIFSKELNYRKIHMSVQGGHVYARVKDEFRKAAGQGNNGMYGGGTSDVNLLRKIQVTYSPERDREFGAAIHWSSEPKVQLTKYNTIYNNNINNLYTYVETSTGQEQQFNVTGYYAIGKYKPFVEQIPQNVDVAIGVGIGIAAIQYHRSVGIVTTNGTNNYNTYQYTRTSTEVRYNNDVNKSVGSAIVFGEVSYFIHDFFSIGLTADYSYFPSIVIPSEPQAGLPEQTLTGNGSVGFVIGIHL